MHANPSMAKGVLDLRVAESLHKPLKKKRQSYLVLLRMVSSSDCANEEVRILAVEPAGENPTRAVKQSIHCVIFGKHSI